MQKRNINHLHYCKYVTRVRQDAEQKGSMHFCLTGGGQRLIIIMKLVFSYILNNKQRYRIQNNRILQIALRQMGITLATGERLMGRFISDAAKRALDLLCVVLGGPFVLGIAAYTRHRIKKDSPGDAIYSGKRLCFQYMFTKIVSRQKRSTRVIFTLTAL